MFRLFSFFGSSAGICVRAFFLLLLFSPRGALLPTPTGENQRSGGLRVGPKTVLKDLSDAGLLFCQILISQFRPFFSVGMSPRAHSSDETRKRCASRTVRREPTVSGQQHTQPTCATQGRGQGMCGLAWVLRLKPLSKPAGGRAGTRTCRRPTGEVVPKRKIQERAPMLRGAEGCDRDGLKYAFSPPLFVTVCVSKQQ